MKEQENESEVVSKGPCPDCGSSDACATYTDGHIHCFSCGLHRVDAQDIQGQREVARRSPELIAGTYKALKVRCISEETCRKFGYQVGTYSGRNVHIAPYYGKDGMVAQKVRFPDKDFTVLGKLKEAGLFGQQLWSSGKKIVITEGEIDCLTVSQMQGNKWPVVSVPNGADGAKKAIAKQLEYLDKFEQVIFMFDMDEPGQKAAAECAELLPPGKAFIAHLSAKDPNELLMANKGGEITSAIWNAKPYRPDGIVAGIDLLDEIMNQKEVESIPYPFECMNKMVHGLRTSELVVLTSGSGMGKSSIVRKLAYHLGTTHNQKIGMLMLEESTKRTALGLMGVAANKNLHVETADEDTIKHAFASTLGNGNYYLYDHFGSTGMDNLLNRVRFMAVSLGCRFIILDHLSIVVSGLGDGDERKLIDMIMTHLRQLVQELDIGMIVVSHLKRPEGNKGHEEGAITSLSQLRGSHSIAQLSDAVWGLERNQQGKTPNVSTIRCLKNRYTGQAGIAGYLAYDHATGGLTETEEPGKYGFDTEASKGEEF